MRRSMLVPLACGPALFRPLYRRMPMDLEWRETKPWCRGVNEKSRQQMKPRDRDRPVHLIATMLIRRGEDLCGPICVRRIYSAAKDPTRQASRDMRSVGSPAQPSSGCKQELQLARL